MKMIEEKMNLFFVVTGSGNYAIIYRTVRKAAQLKLEN